MFQTLKQSFKHRFPFRLSVPSFIYPADYVTNVQRLGGHVDEIELLLFESRPAALPTPSEIAALAALAKRLDLSYNVHLPLDLNLGMAAQRDRNHAVERLVSVIDLVRPLSPTTHTLHLNYRESGCAPKVLQGWQARTMDSLSHLLTLSALTPRALSIETLDYPPDWFAPIVNRLDLAVCLDVGHLLRYGFDLEPVLRQFAERTTIFHLHGVMDDRDHLALNALNPQARHIMQHHLRNFDGSVSLEIFSFERLKASLACLMEMMNVPRQLPLA